MYAVVDCNNFFVSCERVFRPEIDKSPVVVLSNNDGCVISRSNEIKKLGVRMGSPAFENAQLFKEHNVHVFSSNFSLYGDISSRVMQVIGMYAPTMELYSIDEVFIDFEGFTIDQVVSQCRLIKERVQQCVGIPVSIGIGSTKTLAKAANELAKKNVAYEGVYGIGEEFQPYVAIDTVLEKIPVGNIWGIGRKLTVTLQNNNIFSALQLKYCGDAWIKQTMSISVLRTVWELRGIKCIRFDDVHIAKKSIISSRSFGKPVTTRIEMKQAIAKYATRVAEKLREEKEVATTISIYMLTNMHNKSEKQYSNGATISLIQATNYTPHLISAAHHLVDKIYKDGYKYKKAAVMVTGLINDTTIQRNLFVPKEHEHKEKRLMTVIDGINRSFGTDSIHFAAQGYNPRWAASSMMRSPRYSTNWKELLTIQI